MTKAHFELGVGRDDERDEDNFFGFHSSAVWGGGITLKLINSCAVRLLV